MQFTFTLPDSLPQMTVKQLLEEQLLIPRKIRHFLRIKKHILINQREVRWNEMVNPGDICQLTFDKEDYPEKEIPWGNPNLVQEVYQDQHLIIVNKPEGMKTHGNQPNEIALLNHVSAYVGQTCYVVHRLDMETTWFSLPKILLSCLFSIAYWRKKRFLGNIGHRSTDISTAKNLFSKTKLDVIAMIAESE